MDEKELTKLRNELQLIRAHAQQMVERMDKLLEPVEVKIRREQVLKEQRNASIAAQVIANRNAFLARQAAKRMGEKPPTPKKK